jgi:hypothetical protein
MKVAASRAEVTSEEIYDVHGRLNKQVQAAATRLRSLAKKRSMARKRQGRNTYKRMVAVLKGGWQTRSMGGTTPWTDARDRLLLENCRGSVTAEPTAWTAGQGNHGPTFFVGMIQEVKKVQRKIAELDDQV